MKYIITIMLSMLSTQIYADAYIFGGSTHFQGQIVNNSCAISISPDHRSDTPKQTKNVYFMLDVNHQAKLEYAACTLQQFDLIYFSFDRQLKKPQLNRNFFSNETLRNNTVLYMPLTTFQSLKALDVSHSTTITMTATYP